MTTDPTIRTIDTLQAQVEIAEHSLLAAQVEVETLTKERDARGRRICELVGALNSIESKANRALAEPVDTAYLMEIGDIANHAVIGIASACKHEIEFERYKVGNYNPDELIRVNSEVVKAKTALESSQSRECRMREALKPFADAQVKAAAFNAYGSGEVVSPSSYVLPSEYKSAYESLAGRSQPCPQLAAVQSRECRLRGTIDAHCQDGAISEDVRERLLHECGNGPCPHEAAACRMREALGGLIDACCCGLTDDGSAELRVHHTPWLIARAALASTAPCSHAAELAEEKRKLQAEAMAHLVTMQERDDFRTELAEARRLMAELADQIDDKKSIFMRYMYNGNAKGLWECHECHQREYTRESRDIKHLRECKLGIAERLRAGAAKGGGK